MSIKLHQIIVIFFLVSCPLLTYTQEEESAELFLEEYTDEFQENFFEALKQKSIQNYDKAINLFLSCKQLEPGNEVIDYQLAKTHFLDKEYLQAQEYAIQTLTTKPTDFWYLENMVNIMEKQNSPFEVLKERIPFENRKLQENLALIYFKKKRYKDALEVLEGLGSTAFTEELSIKIQDSLDRDQRKALPIQKNQETVSENNPVDVYKTQMEKLLAEKSYQELEDTAKDALEAYPLQPYFHYAYGAALNGLSNPSKSIEVLEGALDYIFDDDQLANKIYQELSDAFNAIGNPTKANEYLNKIKSGL
ncbi:MAG: hypothetical protein AAF969_03765 [Bacteroidota bacterium]